MPTAPTETEIVNQLVDRVRLLDSTFVDAATFDTNHDLIVKALNGEFMTRAPADAMLALYAGSVAQASAAAMLAEPFRQYADFLQIRETDPRAIIPRVFDHWMSGAGSPQRIESRVRVFGTPTADGNNAGDGVFNRLTENEDGFDLEAGFTSPKTAECVRDARSGANKHEEVFLVRGGNRAPNALTHQGSGSGREIRGASARDSRRFLTDPSFSRLLPATDGATVTTLQGWSSSSGLAGLNVRLLSAGAGRIYRDFEGDIVPKSIGITANTILSEDLSVRRARFNRLIPYYAQLAWNRDEVGGGADGTLTFRLGAVTVVVVLAAESGWQVLRIPLGVGNWFRNFNEETFIVSIEVAGQTTGEILIDDVITRAMVPFAGEWYMPVGGRTRWLAKSPAPAPRQGDLFTWADTETGAKIQRWVRIGFPGLWLPHATGGSVTIADP